MTLGQCVVEVDGCEDHVLQSGQFALMPHGAGHRLTSGHGVSPARLFDLPCEQVSDRYQILRSDRGHRIVALDLMIGETPGDRGGR